MRGIRLLQTLLEKSCPKIHKKRIRCIFDVVESLLACKKLWISALGRGIKNKTTAKHNIEKVDMLVGNRLLHADRHSLYHEMACRWIGEKKRPVIIID